MVNNRSNVPKVLRRSLVIHAQDLGPDAGNIARQRYQHPSISIESEKNLPGDPDKNAIRVRIEYCGICGTDLHIAREDDSGFVCSSAPITIPPEGRILGHEAVGQVVATGNAVNTFQPGDWVALESIISCGHCGPCKNNHPNQCDNATLLGGQIDGLFTTIADVPANIAYNVNKLAAIGDKGLKSAACLEPTAVAWLACKKASVQEGDNIAIFGGGPIGLFCALLCKQVFGATRVTVIEPVQYRRQHASMWADAVYSPEEFRQLSVNDIDVIFEASGNLKNVQHNVTKVNAAGRIVLLARSGENLRIDNVDHIITKAISISGVRGHLGGVFSRLIELCLTRNLPLHEAVTGTIDSFEQLADHLSHGDELIKQHCKVLFQPK